MLLALAGRGLIHAKERQATVERVGSPSYYAPQVERYRLGNPDETR